MEKPAHTLNHWSRHLKVIGTTDRPVGDQAIEKRRVGRCRACDDRPPSSGLSRPREGLEVTFEAGAKRSVICRLASALIRKPRSSAWKIVLSENENVR